MSETKSREHPLHETDESVSSIASRAEHDEEARAKPRASQSLTIAAKIDPETLEALDSIGRAYGLLRSKGSDAAEPGVNRSAAVKVAIIQAASAIHASYTHQEAQKQLQRRLARERSQLEATIPALDRQLLEELRDALHNIDASYREMTFQIQKVGYNWNQIARVANFIGNGSDEQIPATAVDAVRRTLDHIDMRLGSLSARDDAIKKALAWLRK